MNSLLRSYFSFIILFLGTGFIAGSVVHFGEGVTVWDASVLLLGICLFVLGSYNQQKKESGTLKGKQFASFLALSLLLSIGVGMASGGVQHFIDTPAYAAVLIPLGLTIGVFAYALRSQTKVQAKHWLVLAIGAPLLAVLVWQGLVFADTIIPESLRKGHGSHASHDDHHGGGMNASQAEIDMATMMGITVEELRNQTPEEHMEMMMNMMGEDLVSEGFLPGGTLDVTTLPLVAPTEVLNVQDGDTITLNPTLVRKELNGKEFVMYGYNGQVPGPIIKAPQGSQITVQVANNIDMETTVHWHGLRLDNAYDGVPSLTQPVIEPGESFTYTIKMPDEGIYWYHPHVREDIQQDMGLYGNILVDPIDADAYNPVNQENILVLDDLFVDQSGLPVAYGGLEHTDDGKEDVNYSLMGRFGNKLLVNGEPDYTISTNKGAVHRFYITNVANTRTFNLQIPGAKLKRVGSDVGRFEREVFVDNLVIAPAERAVVEVYFPQSGTFSLQSAAAKTYTLATINVADEPVTQSFTTEFNTLQEHADVIADIDQFREYFSKPVDKELVLDIEMRGAMAGMDHSGMMHGHSDLDPELEGIEWEDLMPGMNRSMTADELDWNLVDKATGKKNMDINWQFAQGDVVKIRITNDANSPHPMQHPIHLHGQRFLVLNQDGVQNDNLVWKDTVLVPTGATTEILVEMSNPGSWMMHCHIAEHLTNGMMGMFTVTP